MAGNAPKLFVAGVLFLLAGVCIIWVVYVIDQWIQKNHFCKKYGLDSLPWNIRIRNGVDSGYSKYELNYPYWYISKNDGTADRRYKGNRIIWPESYLWVRRYRLSAKKPTVILEVVKELRRAGTKVAMSEEERKKKRRIENQKKIFSCEATVQTILDAYRDCPTEFEQMCAEVFRKLGYHCRVTPKTNDGGYDISIQKGDGTGIVECKCYSLGKKVGRPEIQKLVGANVVQQAQKMYFVTTSSFTPEAREYARETGVTLISGQKLVAMLQKQGLPKKEIRVTMEEWQLNIRDLKDFIPSDIYWDYFA